jgi:hypothetical protein
VIKGVKVSGDHLESISEGVDYARVLLRQSGVVLVEENWMEKSSLFPVIL